MAHQRSLSTVDGVKEPHSVSLKVLRLSRPSLSIQYPLPSPTHSAAPSNALAAFISPSASLAYPSSADNAFILSPLLTLPPAFGSAYVGETFSCTLCANNEFLPFSNASKTISNVRIEAEMKISSSATPIPLDLLPDPKAGEENEREKEQGKAELDAGKTLQKVVNFELKEEGSHVLAVTVTYSETTPTSGRIRTFRKLYQFLCKGCMVVRTKTGDLPSRKGHKGRRWALEAQLENCGEETITLDTVVLQTRDRFRSQGINWEIVGKGEELERPVLMTGDVQQVCFLVEEIVDEDGNGVKESVDGRLVFGILSIDWRGPMGNKGSLSTGNLGTKSK